MLYKLPRWVASGGFILAFVAGMVNTVGLLSFAHQPVSHLTATSSRFAISIADADWETFGLMAAVIASFFCGAVISGWLIRSASLEYGTRYGIALTVESVALYVAVPLLARTSFVGIAFCCFACGLQNGIVSTFSGAIIRTTHMTGLFTDLGVHIGQIIRGTRPDRWRLVLYTSLIVGFMTGGFFGAVVMPYLHEKTLLIPATVTAVAGVAYHFRWGMRPQ